MACCDMHNEHCEPPSELCCGECTEFHHGLHRCDPSRPFALSHHDGSQCVLGPPQPYDWEMENSVRTPRGLP